MVWRDLPYWARGGIIAVGIMIIILIIGFIFNLIFPPRGEEFLGVFFFALMLVGIPGWLILKGSWTYESNEISVMIMYVIVGLLIYFLIGAFIGIVIGKIKQKGKKQK